MNVAVAAAALERRPLQPLVSWSSLVHFTFKTSGGTQVPSRIAFSGQ